MTRRTTSLAADPSSAALARRFVREALGALGRDDLAWAAQQVVSELATNALLHARTTMELAVERTADGARLEVLDGSAVVPHVRRYGGESTTGRGLRMVEELAASWGVDRRDTGKVVWVELRRDDERGHGGDAPVHDADTDLEAVLRAFPDSPPGAGRPPEALAA